MPSVGELPNQFAQDHGLGYTIATARYHRDLTDIFARKFNGEKIRVKTSEFDNHMPLYIVGSARHTMYLMWLPGEDFAQSFTDMCFVGSGLKTSVDRAGPNAETVGIFSPFFDARMDKRGRKDVPGDRGRAIIKSQVETVGPLARAMRSVALADYFATLDFHSFEAAQIIQETGLGFVNLTTARLFAERILGNNPDTKRRKVVVALDANDFNRALPLQQHLEADIAVVQKRRIQKENGVDSTSQSEFVYGSVRDADVYLLDDSISGGGTSSNTVDLCVEQGAATISLCATHPIFVKDYYNNLEGVLSHPSVARVMVTDSLPTEFRSISADMPYHIMPDGRTKEVEVVPVGQFLADAAYTILHAESLDEAKRQLGSDAWTMQDPYTLFEETTGLPADRPEDVGVYHGRQQFTVFES